MTMETMKKQKASGVPALFNLPFGGRYSVNKKTDAPTISLQYTQQLQAPFINSYVPLLPYNTMALGLSSHLENNIMKAIIDQ